MTVEQWPLDRILPYPKNARKIPERAVDKVAASILEFGWQQPIVVDTSGVIVAGHTRRLAALKLGMATAPVVVASHLTPAQIKAYRLMDNRSHEEATWDMELLGVELLELKALDFDLKLTGFELREVDGYFRRAGLTDADDVPPVPDEPVSRRGDLWVLGEHRILCGDATSAEDVALVMGGEKAALMNTDPPYGVDYGDIANSRIRAADKRSGGTGRDYEEQTHPRMANDDLHGEEFQAFLERAIKAALPHLESGTAFYLWHPMLTQGAFAAAAAAAAAAAILIHRQIIWVKPSLIMGRGDYHWRHELCFYGWVKGHRPPWLRGRDQDTVWNIGRENDHVHPTQKPVELFSRPIENHLPHQAIAYEPFAGSGPQFIAAEQLNRRCFGLEIEPRYVDVICRRWEAFSGKQACNEDGETFASVAESRKAAQPQSAASIASSGPPS